MCVRGAQAVEPRRARGGARAQAARALPLLRRGAPPAAPCEVRPSDRVVSDGISMIRHQPDDPCEETLEWVVTWPEKAKLPSVVHSFTTAELKERDPEGGCIFSGKLRQLKSRPLAQQITFDPRGPKDK